jgi:hypothetical protein
LLNASPDLRQQITATPELQPVDGSACNSPIKAVVLTNGDVDHIAGLLNLREGQPFTIYATNRVLQVLESNSVFDVLDKSIVRRQAMALGQPFTIQGPAGFLGLEVEAFAVPGKIALYLEDQQAGETLGTEEGDTVGLKLRECQRCAPKPRQRGVDADASIRRECRKSSERIGSTRTRVLRLLGFHDSRGRKSSRSERHCAGGRESSCRNNVRAVRCD